MHDLSDGVFERLRVESKYGGPGCSNGGAFRLFCSRTRGQLRIIASSGAGWDHISISLEHRCPNWIEMEYVKRLFFKPTELAWQYHMPVKDHISCHPYVLHIWRKQDFEMPTPPAELV